MKMEYLDIEGFEVIKPFRCRIQTNGNHTVIAVEGLSRITVAEKDFETAVRSLSESFTFVWNNYVECDPECLHASAIELREWMLEHVRPIENGETGYGARNV